MKKFCLGTIISIFPFLIIFSANAQSAVLYALPSSANYNSGSIFSVDIKVNSGGAQINAAEASLVFSPDKLEVVSISKANSIFSLWTTDPIFSNSAGTIDFAGGTPSGFSGSGGTLVTIQFKAKKVSVANLNIISGAVLAADGKGTNILANMTGGVYNITAASGLPSVPVQPTTPTPTIGVPLAPAISSTTHPDENKWYSNKNPEFTWKLPSDVTGASLLLDKKSVSNPGNTSDGLMTSKKYENMADGTYYFHIKFKNQYGWGQITHRKVLIDTIPPNPFEIAVNNKGDATNPQPLLDFETTDATSGIGYYEIKIGEGDPFPADRIKTTSSYKLPLQAPVGHQIEVMAFDKAGNSTPAVAEIEVLPIESPTITKYPKGLSLDQKLVLEGTGLPDILIRVFVQEKGKKPTTNEVETDGNGKWIFESQEALPQGDYTAWAQAQDKRGALSLPSEEISFWVGLPPFLKFGKITIDYLTTMITFIVLVIGAIIVIAYGWYRVSVWRKRVRKETGEVKDSVIKAFRALREEVQEQIEYLDKKPGLTKEEKQIRDKLEDALYVSEEFISKEIKDVEKELE